MVLRGAREPLHPGAGRLLALQPFVVQRQAQAGMVRITNPMKKPFTPGTPAPKLVFPLSGCRRNSLVLGMVAVLGTSRLRTGARERRQRRLQRSHGGILNINCWNEWTEGSYLEPDQVHGMKSLEAVRDVFPPAKMK